MNTPVHQHDCEKCSFKGSWNEFDIYVCEREGDPKLDSFIARYGSDGSEYSSMPRTAFSSVVKNLLDGDVLVQHRRKKRYEPLADWMLAVMNVLFREVTPEGVTSPTDTMVPPGETREHEGDTRP